MSRPLIVKYHVFFEQKRGNNIWNYEDAFVLEGVPPIHIEKNTNRDSLNAQYGHLNLGDQIWHCSLADGATQGGFSQLWARTLVANYIDERWPLEPDLAGIESRLQEKAQEWNNITVHQILQQYPEGSTTRYRVQHTLLADAQASTLLMFEIDPTNQRWRAGAIGDTFIFHLNTSQRQWQAERPFPNVGWEDLNTNPVLISSRETDHDTWIWNNPGAFNRHEAFSEGSFAEGDCFFLMTDAIGKWFLRAVQENRDEWEDLLFSITNDIQFHEWLEAHRLLDKSDPSFMGNDDVTLVRLRVSSEPEGTPLFQRLSRKDVLPKLPPPPAKVVQVPVVAMPEEAATPENQTEEQVSQPSDNSFAQIPPSPPQRPDILPGMPPEDSQRIVVPISPAPQEMFSALNSMMDEPSLKTEDSQRTKVTSFPQKQLQYYPDDQAGDTAKSLKLEADSEEKFWSNIIVPITDSALNYHAKSLSEKKLSREIYGFVRSSFWESNKYNVVNKPQNKFYKTLFLRNFIDIMEEFNSGRIVLSTWIDIIILYRRVFKIQQIVEGIILSQHNQDTNTQEKLQGYIEDAKNILRKPSIYNNHQIYEQYKWQVEMLDHHISLKNWEVLRKLITTGKTH